MDVLPPGKQQRLPLDHDPHGTAHISAGHVLSPDQVGDAIGTEEIDLGLTVTEDVSRHMVVDEDDDAEAMRTKHSDHENDNLTRWDIQAGETAIGSAHAGSLPAVGSECVYVLVRKTAV
jgi:hypothetical protein